MKKILFAALAASTVFATPAVAAPTDNDTFTINATVAQECSIGDVGTFNLAGNLQIVETPGSNALTINGSQNYPDQNVWVSCNYGANITLTSQNTGLVNAAGAAAAANDPNDFTNKIHYRLQLDENAGGNGPFGSQIVQLVTAAGPNPAAYNTAGAFHDNARVSVQINVNDNDKRPVAGTYTDVATINLGAV